MLTTYANKNGHECDIDECFNALLVWTRKWFPEYHQEEHVRQILTHFGFEWILEDQGLTTAFYAVMLKDFVTTHTLDEEFLDNDSFPKQHLREAASIIETGSSFTGGVGVAVANTGASSSYSKNFQLDPSFDIMYITGNQEIDNYIRYSLIAFHNYKNLQKMSKMRKLILIQLNNYLYKKSAHVIQMMRKLDSTRFKRNGQYVLSAYLENFANFHLSKNLEFRKYKVIPYLVELNGIPGVGKSTMVDFLSELMFAIFPFYEENDMKYNRVNDRFWNGYKQQPIVIYDDQNQNRELQYNLDNEVISLGSGQFVHPPMAFDKDAKFSSLFVLFTTNKRLLQTTKANKGAVARRVHTFKCEPKAHLGELVKDELDGEYWQYAPHVYQNPFNLLVNGGNCISLVFDFLQAQMKQTFVQDQVLKSFWFIRDKHDVTYKSLHGALNESTAVCDRIVKDISVAKDLHFLSKKQEKKQLKAESVKFEDEYFLTSEVLTNNCTELYGMKPKASYLQGITGFNHGFSKEFDVENEFNSLINDLKIGKKMKMDLIFVNWYIACSLNKDYRLAINKKGQHIYVILSNLQTATVDAVWAYDVMTGIVHYPKLDSSLRSLVYHGVCDIFKAVRAFLIEENQVPLRALQEVVVLGFGNDSGEAYVGLDLKKQGVSFEGKEVV